MKYLKVVNFITLGAIFLVWAYLLHHFEFKDAIEKHKCNKQWRSTSNVYCQKLYENDDDPYPIIMKESAANNTTTPNPNATFVTDAMKYVVAKLMYDNPKE